MDHEQHVKDRILSVTRDRLLQQGYSKVTLDEIATELGMSKKTLYKYFSGKNDLALEAIRYHFGGIECEMNGIVSSALPFIEKLHNIMMMQSRHAGKMNTLVMEDIRKHAPRIWKEMETIRRERILSKIEIMFASARREHVLRPDIDDRIVLMMILASVDAIVNSERALSMSLSIKELVHSIFHIIFEGALTNEAREKILHIDAARGSAPQ